MAEEESIEKMQKRGLPLNLLDPLKSSFIEVKARGNHIPHDFKISEPLILEGATYFAVTGRFDVLYCGLYSIDEQLEIVWKESEEKNFAGKKIDYQEPIEQLIKLVQTTDSFHKFYTQKNYIESKDDSNNYFSGRELGIDITKNIEEQYIDYAYSTIFKDIFVPGINVSMAQGYGMLLIQLLGIITLVHILAMTRALYYSMTPEHFQEWILTSWAVSEKGAFLSGLSRIIECFFGVAGFCIVTLSPVIIGLIGYQHAETFGEDKDILYSQILLGLSVLVSLLALAFMFLTINKAWKNRSDS